MLIIKSNKLQKVIVLKLILLFFVNFSSSQSEIDFELRDSLTINLNDFDSSDLFDSGYGIKFMDNYLFVFPVGKTVIFKFNLTNEIIEKINLENFNNKDNFTIGNIDISKKIITAINSNGSRINHYSWEGKILKSIKTKLFWNKFNVGALSSFEYDLTSDLVYLPIELNFTESFLIKKIKKGKKYYQRNGLVGVFDHKGKLIDKIGAYDSLYHNCEFYYADYYSFILNSKHKIILSQQLGPKISVFTLNPETSVFFKYKGKYISEFNSSLTKTNHFFTNTEYNSATIKSYSYYNTKQINDSLYLRKYVIGTADTTQVDSSITDKSLNIKGQCPVLSERELNQLEIIKNKPEYMQVFNLNNGASYYDGPSKINGYISSQNINFQKNIIWSAKLLDDSMSIYQYSIIKTDP